MKTALTPISNTAIISAKNLQHAKKILLEEAGKCFRLPAVGLKRYYTDSTPLAVCIMRTPRLVVYATKFATLGTPIYELTFEPTNFSRFLESKNPNLKTIDEEINIIVKRLEEREGY